MQTTYHLKVRDVDNNLITAIKNLFQENEYLTITVESDTVDESAGKANVLEFLNIEKKFPPVRISSDLDFNVIANEVNL